MDNNHIPLCSYELRWFFEGTIREQGDLKSWYDTAIPFKKAEEIGSPEWKQRSDVYLVVPNCVDFSMKWREGQLQFKGLISSMGPHVFCENYQGNVERWVKWSYGGTPVQYESLFKGDKGIDLVTVSVKKKRTIRKLRFDTMTGEVVEVLPNTFVDRGASLELADILVDQKKYCSLAIDAFPDDSGIAAAFTKTVEGFLSFSEGLNLTAKNSFSYPAWIAEALISKIPPSASQGDQRKYHQGT